MKNKKILIITFTFPPKPGIGGRRWAKFAKYLHQKKVSFDILTFEKKSSEKSKWCDDVEPFKQNIYVQNHMKFYC